jgi:hypothetical protein
MRSQVRALYRPLQTPEKQGFFRFSGQFAFFEKSPASPGTGSWQIRDLRSAAKQTGLSYHRNAAHHVSPPTEGRGSAAVSQQFFCADNRIGSLF